MHAKVAELIKYYKWELQVAEGNKDESEIMRYTAKVAALEVVAELLELEGLY